MNIELLDLTVRDLVDGYQDNGDDGVRGYGGKLDIRPPFQREFIYKEKERNAVIDTILQGFPLNVMYWADRGDGTYEIIDGQQRTISIAQYIDGDFSLNYQYFHNLPADIQQRILDYPLMVYVCSGTDSEKLAWFRIINIAGAKLTDQELRNAVYAGPWVSDARRYFSRRGCPAYGIGSNYLKGTPIRQDYLETAIQWISDGGIEDYMGRRQHEESAETLWDYFRSVIDWVEAIFPAWRSSMKGVDWGSLYNTCKDENLDPVAIAARVEELLDDDEVQREAGIYPYVLTGEAKHLNLRQFDARMKRRIYRKQEGVCAICKERFEFNEMEADHITPWSEGGKTNEDNCQMLCRKCNREKAAK